jgi:hypothetical protein
LISLAWIPGSPPWNISFQTPRLEQRFSMRF